MNAHCNKFSSCFAWFLVNILMHFSVERVSVTVVEKTTCGWFCCWWFCEITWCALLTENFPVPGDCGRPWDGFVWLIFFSPSLHICLCVWFLSKHVVQGSVSWLQDFLFLCVPVGLCCIYLFMFLSVRILLCVCFFFYYDHD